VRDVGRGGLGARLLHVGARHAGARGREGTRGGAPDAVGGADDDGDLFLERERRIDHRDLS